MKRRTGAVAKSPESGATGGAQSYGVTEFATVSPKVCAPRQRHYPVLLCKPRISRTVGFTEVFIADCCVVLLGGRGGLEQRWVGQPALAGGSGSHTSRRAGSSKISSKAFAHQTRCRFAWLISFKIGERRIIGWRCQQCGEGRSQLGVFFRGADMNDLGWVEPRR
jgi:hypothetical protein